MQIRAGTSPSPGSRAPVPPRRAPPQGSARPPAGTPSGDHPALWPRRSSAGAPACCRRRPARARGRRRAYEEMPPVGRREELADRADVCPREPRPAHDHRPDRAHRHEGEPLPDACPVLGGAQRIWRRAADPAQNSGEREHDEPARPNLHAQHVDRGQQVVCDIVQREGHRHVGDEARERRDRCDTAGQRPGGPRPQRRRSETGHHQADRFDPRRAGVSGGECGQGREKHQDGRRQRQGPHAFGDHAAGFLRQREHRDRHTDPDRHRNREALHHLDADIHE
ncbi:hypothetical protein MSMEI_0636 [Mycolicibacterium smegmatis MC2 155]|uniref:Uncharacterized protein n=1 Tax=Mycolicibacterium smegmatis (strain ATCC 700084 / mc(2)155) TaxID=246196 RepID=I7FWR4_MYCS2|nr:hypothetical protein MSMEI_0636 [Mycolicibacterium smegmatis MC2 155]